MFSGLRSARFFQSTMAFAVVARSARSIGIAAPPGGVHVNGVAAEHSNSSDRSGRSGLLNPLVASVSQVASASTENGGEESCPIFIGWLKRSASGLEPSTSQG